MRFAKVDAQYYCGIDLHSRSMYVCVMDKQGEIVFHRNMPNNFEIFKKYIHPYQPDMAVGVESSSYYYWLADACVLADIPFYLGHAYYMKAVHGGKVKNDRIDSKKIANAFSSIAGIEGGFTLSANANDEPVSELGFKTRTYHILQKAGISTLSMLWFRIIQGKLMDIEHFGKKSYEEVISVLLNSGRILKR